MRKLFAGLLACLFCFPFVSKAAEKIVLSPKNTVTFRGVVDEGSVMTAQLRLAELVIQRAYKDYPIYIVFDSPGGSVDAGLSFIEFAKTLKNVHTITIAAYSMAAVSSQALPGKRYVTENGEYMFHRARGGFQGQFEVGEVESRLGAAKRLILRMERIVAKRIGITVEDYKARAKDEWWLDSEEAIAQKVADGVVDVYCTPSLVEQRESQNVFSIFGVFTLSYSACPTFRYPLPSFDEPEKEE